MEGRLKGVSCCVCRCVGYKAEKREGEGSNEHGYIVGSEFTLRVWFGSFIPGFSFFFIDAVAAFGNVCTLSIVLR